MVTGGGTINATNLTVETQGGSSAAIRSDRGGGTIMVNGGTVTLNMINQYVEGDIVLDSISTIDLSMTNESVLVGAINTDNTAKKISLKLSSDSVLSLTSDTYISSLDNELSDNWNIYSNGKYKLYVDGKEVSINSGTYNGDKPIVEVDLTANENNRTKNNNAKESNNVIYYIVGGCAVIIALTSGIILIIKKRKN